LVQSLGSLLGSDDLSSSGAWDNPYIWRAVDQFKAQGYSITSTELMGQGSQGNPYAWVIVMSK